MVLRKECEFWRSIAICHSVTNLAISYGGGREKRNEFSLLQEQNARLLEEKERLAAELQSSNRQSDINLLKVTMGTGIALSAFYRAVYSCVYNNVYSSVLSTAYTTVLSTAYTTVFSTV